MSVPGLRALSIFSVLSLSMTPATKRSWMPSVTITRDDAGHQVGRLDDHAVAPRQRRRDLPGGNGDGEVPGRDDAHHADGLARDLHADARSHGRQGLAAGAQRLAGEELEDVAGALDLADR